VAAALDQLHPHLVRVAPVARQHLGAQHEVVGAEDEQGRNHESPPRSSGSSSRQLKTRYICTAARAGAGSA
jgi:hypothetical protein